MPEIDAVAAVLGGDELPGRLRSLGLRSADVDDGVRAARRVAEHPADLFQVAELAARARSWLGVFPGRPGLDRWGAYEPGRDPYGEGVLALLALVATADDLARFHAGRRVPAGVSAQTLTELGQQVLVHRQATGTFGLHTYGWLPWAWSGSLYWLGRLQFNLELVDGEWVWSTHIPQSGPLDPTAVDESFRAAAAFFPACFADYPVTDFWCWSWLLDPDLAAALPADSNMARFQRRWRLSGPRVEADDDVVFFTFARRSPADLDALPRDTTLQRVLLDRLQAGGHWSSCQGRITVRDWAP